ncbi:hypothetical protein, partial [Rickettsiella grylli]|uniref:hypothetical protein n=1 Tax=Rickettsiella grylli TaxID=59196 RepID=UPI000AA12165
ATNSRPIIAIKGVKPKTALLKTESTSTKTDKLNKLMCQMWVNNNSRAEALSGYSADFQIETTQVPGFFQP